MSEFAAYKARRVWGESSPLVFFSAMTTNEEAEMQAVANDDRRECARMDAMDMDAAGDAERRFWLEFDMDRKERQSVLTAAKDRGEDQ